MVDVSVKWTRTIHDNEKTKFIHFEPSPNLSKLAYLSILMIHLHLSPDALANPINIVLIKLLAMHTPKINK
jgi:hypothetical protein